MSLHIVPLSPEFAAEVQGVDLRQPLSAEAVAAIEAGMDRYAVLVYRKQHLDDEQQLAFSRNFGNIEHAIGSNVTPTGQRRLSTALADVSNLDQNHAVFRRDDRRRLFNLGNRLWHSDSSFRAVPAKYSILSGRRVPARGGNTEFADMRAAYDALDAEIRAEVEDLVCQHSLMYSRGLLGFDAFTEHERRTFAPVRQRLVRTHPVTGRRSLYLASHAGAIEGWPMPEARCFLRDLVEHATQPEFVHVHRWNDGDLVMWDNRQTMHRVRAFRETEEVRDMRRTTIAGEAPTIEQVVDSQDASRTTA